MKIFTYNDYIKSIHYLKRNPVKGLAEEGIQYNLLVTKDKNSKNADKPHDKLIKQILKNKNELIGLINKFLNPKHLLKENDVEKYTNSYITKKYKSKEADIVYKLKEKDVYFLIEHQSKIDYNMAYRVLNYCIDIVQEWKKEQKNKKISRYPTVVPIVIYTGTKKWNAYRNYKDQQIKVTTYEKYRIDLKYNLIDVNEYTKKELLDINTMFGYAMLLEKSKDKKEFVKNMQSIIKKENDKERLENLSDILIYLFNGMMEEDIKEELIKMIEKKVGDNDMESLVKRILDEEKRQMQEMERKGEKIGEQKVIIRIAKKLLELREDEEFVKKVTNIKDEELMKIK